MEKLTIEQRLERIETLLLNQKTVLNIDEATIYLSVSKSHLYKMTSAGRIPHYKPTGKRIYFKRNELENWMLRNRVKSYDEIETEAANYLMRNKFKS